MIPYLIWFIFIVLIFIFWREDLSWGDYGGFFVSVVVVTAVVGVYLFSNGFTEEERQITRIADNKKDAMSNAPQTTKQELGDGCVLYYHYANGVKNFYTTKYVRCHNSTVDTEKKWSCGTPKAPKTCTETVSTKDEK